MSTSQVSKRKGVTIYKPESAYNGYTLFCPMSKRIPNVPLDKISHNMYLIDMEGRVVHEWTAKTTVQLLELLPNGNLYYMTRDSDYPQPMSIRVAGIREIDPKSNVLWWFHCRSDHDFHVMDNGHIMILCVIDKMAPNIGPELKRCPYIIEITKEKELLWEWFGEEHVKELEDLCGLRISPTRKWDWAHNNTLEVLPDNPSGRKDSRFKKGNILFSYRNLDTIGVIDRDTGKIVWAWGSGILDSQHQPTMLPNGNILIFDNGTRRGWSRVIEVNPLEEEIVWEYVGTPKESFYSPFISGAQLLPNGNIFICEGGPRRRTYEQPTPRLFEVTRDGEIVWEYLSPYAPYSIYRATRYSPEFVKPLLETASKE